MDYKINNIAREVRCEEVLIQDIQSLLFTELENVVVFDATAFCRINEFGEFDWRTFSRINKVYIEGLVNNTGLDRKKLFFSEKNGHVLVVQDLVFIFLAFIDPNLCVYFNNLIADAISNGVAFSDGFAVQLASQRIPTDVLKDIINKRNDKEQG